jgi:RNA-directed DNA polymerase
MRTFSGRHTAPRASQVPRELTGSTAEAYAEHLDENLRHLHERLRSGRSQAASVESAWIEQEDGSHRPIGTPAFKDKIVHNI